MKHIFDISILVLFMAFVLPAHAAKLRIAILDIKPGVGQNSSQIEGLEDMLTNELFKSGYFTIIERARVNQVLHANNLYGKRLTTEQYKTLADKLQVDAVLIGTINFIVRDVKTGSDRESKFNMGEYNVDLRLISVNGVVLSSAAVQADGKNERETMDLAAREIVKNLDSSIKSNNSVQVLYDYLYVFPEDLGVFSSKPVNIIAITNRNNAYGFSDWRLPTDEEVQILKANSIRLHLDNNRAYASDAMNLWNGTLFNVRLVRSRIVVEQRPVYRQIAYFEDTDYDFGQIPILGGIVKTRFCLQNPSNRAISINNVTKTDSHISAEWKKEKIESGEKGFIIVSYDPNGRQGVSFRSTLVVTLDDGQKIDLKVSGTVQ